MPETEYWVTYDLAGHRQTGWLDESQLDGSCEYWVTRDLAGHRSTEWIASAEIDASCVFLATYDRAGGRETSMVGLPPALGGSFRKPLVVQGAQIPGALTNFPLLVDVGGDAGVQAHARADLEDVRFYDTDGTTPLVHQWVNNKDGSTAWFDGCWSWFSEPRAVCAQGTKRQLYAGWVASNGDVMVGSRDLDSGATALFTLHAALEVDDHDSPVFLVRSSDKRLLVFYSKHNAESQLYYRISTNPEDVTAWGTEQVVTTGGTATYSNVFQVSGSNNPGRIYWFYRLYDPGLQTMRTSDDGGVTWSAEVSLLTPAEVGARPYVKYCSDGVSKVHVFFTDGHPRDVVNCDLHHVYIENGNFYATDGTLIAAVASGPLLTSSVAKIYDAGAEKSWCWDITLDATGKPVVVFATFPTETAHRYHYGRWTGSAWDVHTVVDNAGGYIATVAEPQYSGGIVLDNADPTTVYCSVNTGVGTWEIRRTRTVDGGATWSAAHQITAGSTDKQCRPYSPRNRLSGCPEVFWWGAVGGGYVTYQNYQTAIKCWPPRADARRRAVVKVPSLSAGVDKTIYVRYGGPEPAVYVPSVPYDANELTVWQRDTVLFADRVRNVLAVVSSGVAQPADPPVAAGLTGSAFLFDGNETFNIGQPANLAGLAALTVSAWVKMDVLTGTQYFVSSWQQPTHPNADFMLRIVSGALSGFVTVQTDTQIGGTFPDLVIADTNWHRVTMRFDNAGADLQMLLDGVLSGTTFATAANMDATATAAALLGDSPHVAPAGQLFGTMEPPEFSNIARSVNYELMRFRAERNQASVVVMGAEESLP